MDNFYFDPLVQAVVDGESDDAVELVEDALKGGIPEPFL